MFIDENTSRDDLLSAIYSEMVDYCISKNFEPETASNAELLDFVRSWIEEGDETFQF
jgi:hypothetical protein